LTVYILLMTLNWLYWM